MAFLLIRQPPDTGWWCLC